jgi:hypothetical protein
MSLVAQLTALSARIANEIKGLVRPTDPGLARAWASFGFVNGSLVTHSASRVTSVTPLATGRYRVNFDPPLPDSHYCWVATARSSTTSGPVRFITARDTTDAKTGAYLDLSCVSSTGAHSDSEEVNLVVYR